MENKYNTFEFSSLSDTGTDELTDLLNDLGIQKSDGDKYKLILWNDHVNDMMYVTVALYEICKLKDEECVRVMLEAHEKGKAVVKTGSEDELMEMKKGLNERNIEATVEKE